MNENEFETCRLIYRYSPWRWFSFLRIFGYWSTSGEATEVRNRVKTTVDMTEIALQ